MKENATSSWTSNGKSNLKLVLNKAVIVSGKKQEIFKVKFHNNKRHWDFFFFRAINFKFTLSRFDHTIFFQSLTKTKALFVNLIAPWDTQPFYTYTHINEGNWQTFIFVPDCQQPENKRSAHSSKETSPVVPHGEVHGRYLYTEENASYRSSKVTWNTHSTSCSKHLTVSWFILES